MRLGFFHKTKTIALATSVLALDAGFAHADNFGAEVINIAEVAYTIGNVTITEQTNAASFFIEPPRDIVPTIEFFRQAPNAPSPQYATLNGSDYSPSGNMDGPFIPTGQNSTTGSSVVVSGTVPVIPATSYVSGELMFVQVIDINANRNSNEIETIVVNIDTANGDVITLRLYETSADSGEFWAYVPTTTTETSNYDGALSTDTNTAIKATYQSSNGAADVVVDSAIVDPCNVVFDTSTGEPVNGAQITLMNVGTGGQATVFGVDTYSTFPSQVVSGVSTQDEAGLSYINEDGGFAFPYLQAGEYVIEVIPPEGYNFASGMSPDLINSTTGAGYFIIDASYGMPYRLDEAGPLRFDIPLDKDTDLLVTKTADRLSADIGDYVYYTINIDNKGDATAPVNLVDTLPFGFRYVPGTARMNTELMADPVVKNTGTELSFPMGLITPGQSIRLDYALEVGPGAQIGDAVNRAVIQTNSGQPLSNVGRAAVTIREDLFRSKSTVTGRVSEKSCDAVNEWTKDETRGIGVEGVRIYMETGAYAVSDEDGLFHFEGISEGAHVVQIDEETLPQGFAPMICEEDSRLSNGATSKMIDIRGGGIWRTNFYLQQVSAREVVVAEKQFSDTTEYQEYDAAWLDTQNDEIEWVYPLSTRTPSAPSVNIGIKHPAGSSVKIRLNGREVSQYNYEGRDSNSAQDVNLSRWKGVDILKGKNVFETRVEAANGQVLKRFSTEIWFADNIARASAVPDQSVLVADGRTVPSLAIRLEDEGGHAVNMGRIANIEVEQPYRLFNGLREDNLLEGQSELLAPLSSKHDAVVGVDGIVQIKLEPTLRTGKVTVNVTLDNGRIVPLYLYMTPEKRDWIVVGLAEGSVGYETIRDKAIALDSKNSDVMNDGRVAFFAKGLIKGNWLLTLAVDTDKRRGRRDGDFTDEIDPNAYYTLYGDRSYQEYEGISRYPVYVKLEKSSAYALFGDYETDIPEGRLTAYNRTLTGLKAEYVGKNFQVLGFAAETNQGFAEDEIPALGTSGTYQLSNTHILVQSERVYVETRDRNRPDIILERTEMVRYLDYTLDYLTGELIFRLPVDVSDENFNPKVIVVDYETASDAERNVTFGGRAQAELMDGRLRIGSTAVQENGAAGVAGSKSNMIGVDAVAKLGENTEVRAEYAITENSSDDAASQTASAILAEVIHTSDRFSGEAYYREEEPGFGLGQRGSNTNGIRRYGVAGKVKISEFEDQETGRRGNMTAEATAYHEDNLSTGNSRDTGEFLVSRNSERFDISGGLRAARDKIVGSDDRQSLLAIAQATLKVPDHGASFTITQEQPLGGKDEVTNYPMRTVLGVDKSVGRNSNVSIRHEILKGANASGQNTTIGVRTAPWTGATATASSDYLTGDSARRLGATIGLDQQIQINDKWSASGGVRSRRVLDEQGEYIDVAGDAAISPLEVNESFVSGYAGLGYKTDVTSISGRIEARDSSASKTVIGSVAAAREMSETLSFAGAGRFASSDPDDVDKPSTRQSDLRLGAAWRPRDNRTIIYDRLDISDEKDALSQRRTKVVNNVSANTLVNDRWQLTGHYGAKYVREDVSGTKQTNFTNLVGGEMRFDVTPRIDLGLNGSVTVMSGSNQVAYSYGPSVGVSPVEDIWISAGYNFEGYKDDDFEAAEFSRDGFYVKLRIKFDQHTAKGLLRRISPASQTVGTSGVQPKTLSGS